MRTTLLLTAATVALAACGRGDHDDRTDRGATTDTAGGTVVPPSANIALAVRDVRLGKHVDASRKVTTDEDEFATRDTVWASVYTNGSTPGATVSALWRYQDGTLVDSTALNVPQDGGDRTTEFYFAPPRGTWPKGKYTLTVLINGTEARQKGFKVK